MDTVVKFCRQNGMRMKLLQPDWISEDSREIKIVWWNLADNTAMGAENLFHAYGD